MMLVFQVVLCFVASCFLQEAGASEWESGVNEEGRNVQTLKIQAPSMTEEDQYGYTMPEQYRCDSCKVVAYHLGEALKKKDLKSRRLKEWEVQEVFDDTCRTGFAGYGISHVNGESVLSGPALKRDNLEAGMGAIQMGGETWEKRLGEICRKFIYEKIGEDEVYDHFRSTGEISSNLCFSETHDCQLAKLGPEVPPGTSEVKKANEKKKVKKEKKAAEIDLSTFISKLEKQHGAAATKYSRKRTFAEWEQLFVKLAEDIRYPLREV